MHDHQKKRVTRSDRLQWKRPELRRMIAGKAEIGTATATDAINTAS
jgi:hypothetical protein